MSILYTSLITYLGKTYLITLSINYIIINSAIKYSKYLEHAIKVASQKYSLVFAAPDT